MAGPYSYAIRIEGVGQGIGSTNSEGVAWYMGVRLSAAQQSASAFGPWVGGKGSNEGLVERERMTISDSVDPFTSDLRQSSFTFEIHYSDLAGQLLLSRQSQTDRTLAQDFEKNDTTIRINSTTNLENSIVWLADEAIELGSNIVSNQYNVTAQGRYGTIATSHKAGEFAYTAIPYHASRQVQLFEYDHSTNTTVVKWTGYLVSDIKTNSQGTKLTIPCRGLFSVLSGARINRGAPRLNEGSQQAFLVGRTDNGIRSVGGGISHKQRGFEKRVARTADLTHRQAYQADQVLVWAEYFTSTGGGRRVQSNTAKAGPDFVDDVDASSIAAAELKLDNGGFVILNDPIYEIFVVDRAFDVDEDGETIPNKGGLYSATRDLNEPFHPLSISLALLQSSKRGIGPNQASGEYSDEYSSEYDGGGSGLFLDYDCLGGAWGLALPQDWFDGANITTQLSESKGWAKVDKYILGWNGEEVDVWNTIKTQLLQPWGFFPGTNSAGLITFGRFRSANIKDWCDAPSLVPIPDTLQWSPERADSVDTISGRVGARPWNDGTPITVNARDYSQDEIGNSTRAGLFTQIRSVDIDFRTVDNINDLIDSLISKIVTLHFSAPRLKIRVNNADTYDIGLFYRVSSADVQKLPDLNGWFIDKDGNPTTTTTDDFSFIGMLISRQFDIRRQVYELELLLLNYRTGKLAKLRSPSGEVLELQESNRQIIFCNTAFSDNDAAKFFVGDVVEVFKPDWTLRSGTIGAPNSATVTSVGSDYIIIDVAFTTTPLEGDIIEIARLGEYPENGNPNGPTDCDLGYTYAGASGTVGPSAAEAHIYSDDGL